MGKMLYQFNSFCVIFFITIGILQLWSRAFLGNPSLLFPAYSLVIICYGLNFIFHVHHVKKEMFYSLGICIIILFNIHYFHLKRIGITLLAFYCFVLLISIAPYLSFPQKIVKYLSFFSFCALFVFNIMPTDLNPNMIAYGNLFFAFWGTVFIDFNKLSKGLFLGVIIYLICFLLIFYTECRTVLFLLVLSFVLRIIPCRFLCKKFIYKSFFSVILLGGILFAFFYLYLYIDSLGDMTEELGSKRLFSGREKIWAELFVRMLDNNVFAGIQDSSYLECFPDFNPHSTFVAILTLYGVAVFVLFYMLNLSVLLKFRLEAAKVYLVKNCIVFYACFLIAGYTEMNLINLLFLNVLPLLVIGSNINHKKKNNSHYATISNNSGL